MTVNTETITSEAYISGIQRITSDSWISSTTHSLTSDSYITAVNESILCDGELRNEYIDEFGKDIVIRAVTQTYDAEDPYEGKTETNTDHPKKALVLSYTADDDEVKEGTFKSGEMVFSFKSGDESYVETGNRILYAGEWFEIDQVIKQPTMDVLYYLQARVKKI